MISRIYIDKIGLSYHGGVEKNTIKIQHELGQRYSHLNILESWKDFLLIIKVILASRGTSVNYFTFKSGALRCMLLTFLFPRVKIFIRVNNSPEAYLFWKGFKSLISFSLRLLLLKRKNVYFIFNSKTVMDFYMPSMATNNYCYLPNYYDETYPIRLDDSAPSKIFSASRLSPEKRYDLTLEIFKSINAKTQLGVNYYSSSKINQNMDGANFIKNFEDLRINYNDIYLSLSAFEGMPNMAMEALLSGAKLVLSNCWAHAELKEFTKNYDLNARVTLLETIDQQHVEEMLLSMSEISPVDEFNDVRQKLLKMKKGLESEFGNALDTVCNFIDD